MARFKVVTQEEITQPTSRFSVVEPEEKKPLNKNFVQGVISSTSDLDPVQRALKTGADLIEEAPEVDPERATKTGFQLIMDQLLL